MKLSTFDIEGNKNKLIILLCIIGFIIGLVSGVVFVNEYTHQYTNKCKEQLSICIKQCAKTNPGYAYNISYLSGLQ